MPDELALAPEGAPLLVSARISRAFLQRIADLDDRERRVLLLAATSESGDLALLERAAHRLGVELSGLSVAEHAGLISIRGGTVEFRHPLARSAIYADALPEQRRAVHRALASALPDRDIDRRAWHLAAAAVGVDEQASAALEQAAHRARDRSAYATAALAFERAGRLASDRERRVPRSCSRLHGRPGTPALSTTRSRCWRKPARQPTMSPRCSTSTSSPVTSPPARVP